ncbi:MAG TPA: TetR/AcrR family transcriptional regulator [Steroidobacteraceae bacterium]|jgi:AcrR family transcriptional regulator|nr:TetR/AcrR family transcriptional regulator [Steroidobacteraceae bacterium]
MTTKRRMGSENSATRTTLMDAVEAVMREHGYAAISARSVAGRAGLKYQIVFYYFETMDDLLLATYRRRTQAVLTRAERALESDQPLHALWTAHVDPSDAALSLEYMAMSNHNQVIRTETIAFGEQVRHLLADRLSPSLRQAGPDPSVFTPLGITLALTALASILGFESALGLSGGHREAEGIARWFLQQLEPAGAATAAARPRLKTAAGHE